MCQTQSTSGDAEQGGQDQEADTRMPIVSAKNDTHPVPAEDSEDEDLTNGQNTEPVVKRVAETHNGPSSGKSHKSTLAVPATNTQHLRQLRVTFGVDHRKQLGLRTYRDYLRPSA